MRRSLPRPTRAAIFCVAGGRRRGRRRHGPLPWPPAARSWSPCTAGTIRGARWRCATPSRSRWRRGAAARPTRAAAGGSVALVGGGPGDPELITVRGRRLVAEADVVVVDRLAPRALLDELAPAVEIVDCGKSAHRQNLTQDEINAVLVDRARAGKRVVRLKGGDPFVFGRGGEEWLACVGGRCAGHRRAGRHLGPRRTGRGRHPADPPRRLGRLHRRVRAPRPGPLARAWDRLAGLGRARRHPGAAHGDGPARR